jgi:hypothetical protein
LLADAESESIGNVFSLILSRHFNFASFTFVFISHFNKASCRLQHTLSCFNQVLFPNVIFSGQYGQARFVDGMLGYSLKNGFFVEAGAFDGVEYSNSLRFELRGAIHQLLSIILILRILVLLPVSTMPYVVNLKNYSLIGE